MQKNNNGIVYSPSDLIRYFASPFASWMDRYYLENPNAITPDSETDEQKLIAQTGDQHERLVLDGYKTSDVGLVEIVRETFSDAKDKTNAALAEKAPVIYQAALANDRFAGYADFLVLGEDGHYQVWDTKLARSPKPYYALQLCCYSEMLASTLGEELPKKFGIILGSQERVVFRVEDFVHYYHQIKDQFLCMQDGFTGNMDNRPEPLPGTDHGRWSTYADKYFEETDHLLRVAGITVGQIKKLKASGITTLNELAAYSGKPIPKLASDTLEKLVAQARLQCQTRLDQSEHLEAPPRFELLPQTNAYKAIGLAALPPAHPNDVFFDMEGYPLISGGLEYLFGACSVNQISGELEFRDWWAHDRDEEKLAFEGFVDWVFKQWCENPGMHIYHYASYELSALRRLSTRHDTRQDEVDELLRHEVFIDLYQIVRQGLRVGGENYSIKTVERLYRPSRATEVATAVDSIVRYARWMESGQFRIWTESSILTDIREYNKDDCKSTSELLQWMKKIAEENGIGLSSFVAASTNPYQPKVLPPEVLARLEVARKLHEQQDPVSIVLADLIDFHRREDKPKWWRMFDRAEATPEELRDDPGCIEGIQATGSPWAEKLSLVQAFSFDPSQECKLTADDKVMFTHNLEAKFTLSALDISTGQLHLKISKKALNEKLGGIFPNHGSLLCDEFVSSATIQKALTEVAEKHLSGTLHQPAKSLLERVAPALSLQDTDESTTEAAIRVTSSMNGGCLVIQGPPGTGKTYTASKVICALVGAGKKVGVTSNSHKAVVNLLIACGEAFREGGGTLQGIKVLGDDDGPLFSENPAFRHIKETADARSAYTGGVVGGTAWLFSRPEWDGALDYLFVDEAGQVSLANTIAVARSTKNLVLLGDQMQLEQPIQGTHPGDGGLSGLQFALKNLDESRADAPVFHAVVPKDYGLFLGESRRMHPAVCRFISDSIYEGRLGSHPDCIHQEIAVDSGNATLVTKRNGISFVGVIHDGNIQQSDEEVAQVKSVYEELIGRQYTAKDGTKKALSLEDFLFVAPYNAQVRALQAALPTNARVGSVDKFQGQQAPVCILSLCSSCGEYGSRGLAFILDRNRINVAISRAQCLAVVVADPRIASATAGSLNEMNLLNLFCKLAQYAS